MKKILVIAKINNNQRVTIEISYDKGRLSLMANHWNHLRTDCYHCGQMQDTIREWLEEGYHFGKIRWLYSKDRIKKILDIWDRWHLNDMRAECEHQRELGWTWDNGHAETPCPVCGYRLGSAWLKEPVPQSIIDELFPEYKGLEETA